VEERCEKKEKKKKSVEYDDATKPSRSLLGLFSTQSSSLLPHHWTLLAYHLLAITIQGNQDKEDSSSAWQAPDF